MKRSVGVEVDGHHFPVTINDSSGDCIMLTWPEAEQIHHELGVAIQEHDRERNMEANMAGMLATTAAQR